MNNASPLRPGAREGLAALDRVLEKAYGAPEADLGNMEDPLDEAIYIILSFQTDLPRSRSRWFALRSAYPTWESLARAPLREVAKVLREGGLHRQKARTIRRLLAE